MSAQITEEQQARLRTSAGELSTYLKGPHKEAMSAWVTSCMLGATIEDNFAFLIAFAAQKPDEGVQNVISVLSDVLGDKMVLGSTALGFLAKLDTSRRILPSSIADWAEDTYTRYKTGAEQGLSQLDDSTLEKGTSLMRSAAELEEQSKGDVSVRVASGHLTPQVMEAITEGWFETVENLDELVKLSREGGVATIDPLCKAGAAAYTSLVKYLSTIQLARKYIKRD